MGLLDKYRPRTYGGVVGQEKAVTVARHMATRCKATGEPVAVGFVGGSGWGKSTLAWIMGADIAGENVTTIESGKLDRDAVDRIRDLIGIPTGPRLFADPPAAVVVEEIHTATTAAIQSLLTVLDTMRPYSAFIFTSNRKATELVPDIYAGPIQRRATICAFTDQGIATRKGEPGPGPMLVKSIMQAEGLNGKPDRYYVDLFGKGRDGGINNNIGIAILTAEREALEEAAQ